MDAETNPRLLAWTLMGVSSTTEQTARYLINRAGSADGALRSIAEAHDSAEQLFASLALAIRTQPQPNKKA
jgi:hypothetical protein